MAKIEWGSKRMCQSCGVRFYDLHRNPIVCPVCSAVHDPDRAPKPRRAPLKDATSLPPSLSLNEASDDVASVNTSDKDFDVETAEFPEETAAEASDDDVSAQHQDIMEDTSDLGQDDDDIGEVMEHIDDGSDEKA